MFHFIIKRLKNNSPSDKANSSNPISPNIEKNLEKIKDAFADASDVVIREFEIGTYEKIKASIVCIDGLVDKDVVQTNLMKPLMIDMRLTKSDEVFDRHTAFSVIKKRVLAVSELKESGNFEDAIDAVLSGDTALFLDGSSKVFIISTRGWQSRGISQPDTEVAVRGPREGFTETLRTNTAQLRRKIKNPNLKFESMKIGKQTKTDVVIAYIKDIANEKVVEEVIRRLNCIDADSILESGYIEEFIEDAPLSFFPTVGNSEKPDKIAAKMLEGRVAILTDGTPFVLTVPYVFAEAFQSSEDYYSRPYYVTIVRWIRLIAFFLSVFSPALYVATTTYHQEMIPPSLLISMAAAREGTPFPALIEALGMIIVFEIVREAGVRLPRPVGQAVSIVGALVIGDAAVTAGLIGAPMVIVVAITAISSFLVPPITDATSVLRLLNIITAGVLGLFGVMIGLSVILIHMVSLRSFGIPYMSPIAPFNPDDLKDVFIRAPWWAMSKRPWLIGKKNLIRQGENLMPSPYQDDEED